eukprot:6206112-Pleurochrysis_carterae.AAC.2
MGRELLSEIFGVEVRQAVVCDGCGKAFRRTDESLGLQLALAAHKTPDSSENCAYQTGQIEADETLHLADCLAAHFAPQVPKGSRSCLLPPRS